MKIFGLLSMALFSLCYIPQIRLLLKTKNGKGLSVSLLVMVIGGYLSGLVYLIQIKDMMLVLTYGIGLVLTLYTLYLVIYYRKKEFKVR